MATRFVVLRCEDAEPDDRVYVRVDDRHGDSFEVDLSPQEAVQLASELIGAVELGEDGELT